MALAELVTSAIHVLFAGLWTGSVVLVALTGMPEGGVGRFKLLSRTSALLLLLTGGHMAGTKYTAASLTGTTSGLAVVAMVLLWLALGGLVEVAASRYESDGPEAARSLLTVAGVVATLLLLDGGLLAAGL
ncbi:MAG: transporter [Haloferacaceae archaeon]